MQYCVNKDRKTQLKCKSNYRRNTWKDHVCIQTNLRVKISFRLINNRNKIEKAKKNMEKNKNGNSL